MIHAVRNNNFAYQIVPTENLVKKVRELKGSKCKSNELAEIVAGTNEVKYEVGDMVWAKDEIISMVAGLYIQGRPGSSFSFESKERGAKQLQKDIPFQVPQSRPMEVSEAVGQTKKTVCCLVTLDNNQVLGSVRTEDELCRIYADLFALALNPYHGVEQNIPSTVEKFVLQFSSSVERGLVAGIINPPLTITNIRRSACESTYGKDLQLPTTITGAPTEPTTLQETHQKKPHRDVTRHIAVMPSQAPPLNFVVDESGSGSKEKLVIQKSVKCSNYDDLCVKNLSPSSTPPV
ncbi:hypothetical protein K1719_005724 [Acacia pycnantha]|nr:hypothetical protein K1719_005724 [Acacia pycnantha]